MSDHERVRVEEGRAVYSHQQILTSEETRSILTPNIIFIHLATALLKKRSTRILIEANQSCRESLRAYVAWRLL